MTDHATYMLAIVGVGCLITGIGIGKRHFGECLVGIGVVIMGFLT